MLLEVIRQIVVCFVRGLNEETPRKYNSYHVCLLIFFANVFFIVNHCRQGLVRLEKVLCLAHRTPH